MDKLLEKRVKELGYKGCRNCKHQIAPLRTCELLRGGDAVLHLICPKWEKKEMRKKTRNERAVDTELVRHGKWIMKSDPYGFFEIPVCSVCGCTTKLRKKTKFCPNCGAKMDEEKENAKID